MRITNKIMQNNSLSNINLAKVAEDMRASQVTSGKKIVRPSDDPIVAIRSLRLRSSVVEITQYYERNAKDADAWLKTTEDAIQQASDVLTDMTKQYNKGANEYLTSSERNIILEQLKALQKEVYATGDADYAGRYIFTGYRTESSLMFREDTNKAYQITEQFTASDLKTNTFVNTGYPVPVYVQATEDDGVTPKVDDNGNPVYVQATEDDGTTLKVDDNGNPVYVQETNPDGSLKYEYRDLVNLQEGTQEDYATVEEKLMDKADYHRIRLSYKDCVEGEDTWPVIEYNFTKNAATGEVTASDKYTVTREAKSTDVPSPYMDIGEEDVIYLSDTGELLLGDKVYKNLSGLVDNPHTNDVNEGEFRVTYQKSEFREGDLKPEHYFYCVAAGDNGELGITPEKPVPDPTETKDSDAEIAESDNIKYNPYYLTYGAERQVIEYDVGYNQRLQVNTIAEECFNPSVTREVDDMIQALEKIQKIEDVIGTLKNMLEKETDPKKQKVLNDQLDAANKAFTYEKEVVQKKFSSGLTVMQGFLNEVNIAATNCGARGSRLELVSSRLSSQKATFETLKSENEDVDLSEAVVQLTSAEMTYEAALKATGKIMQVNLMDFI